VALMPWKETDIVKERVKFLLEWETRWGAGEGFLNLSALCRELGVRRQVGYDWTGSGATESSATSPRPRRGRVGR
jgi:hypothetical protein